MKFGQLKQRMFIFLAILIILWILLAFVFFMSSLTRIEGNSIEQSLSKTADSNAAQVRFVFERYINTLKTTALSLEGYDDFTSDEAMAYLQRVTNIEGYTRLAVDTPDGLSYTSDGFVFDITHLNYLDRIQAGEPFVLDVIDALTDGLPLISVLIPLHDARGVPIAALRCSISTEKMTELFDRTFFDAGGYYHLVDGNGRYVAAGKSPEALLMGSSFFDAIDELVYEEGFSAQQIKATFVLKQEGFSKYSYDGHQRYAYFLPVGINNWVLMMIAPKEIVEARTILHQNNSLLLTAQIVVIFSIILFYVYFSQKKGKTTAVLNEKCFRVLSEQTGKVILEWDFSSDQIVSLGNFRTIFGRDIITQQGAQDALSTGAIHPDDHVVFDAIFETILRGEPVNDIRFRIRDNEGQYRWSQLSGLVVSDQKGRPFKAIGTLENIDEQVRIEHELRQKAERDVLTSLYNKATTEHLIKEALAIRHPDDAPCALMIIDVDNFKNVNDSFGHLYGDIVLSSLAENLKQIFRSGDIIGRIGGDEFFVFLENFGSSSLLVNRANDIRERFRHNYQEGTSNVQISASVGIAICPTHGNDFDTLYRHTDSALYVAKAKGKDAFCIFDGTNRVDYHSTRTAFDTQGSVQKNFKDNRMEYIFKLLYDSEDPIASVQSALKLVSIHFHFSHSYLFEFDDNAAFLSSTFEWHSDGTDLLSPELQHLSRSDCAVYIKPLEETGFFILGDCTAMPSGSHHNCLSDKGVYAMLQFAIKSQGRLIGSIRFDDCICTRDFSAEELDELSTICHVLSTFLVKQRSLEREGAHHKDVQAVLDHMNHYVYVIDLHNYHILYENKHAVAYTGKISVGEPCYAAYCGRKTPCESCPLHLLAMETPSAVTEVFNPKYDRFLRVGATQVDWSSGQPACLINCVDITEYKQLREKS